MTPAASSLAASPQAAPNGAAAAAMPVITFMVARLTSGDGASAIDVC
jgi:hypothetical protein